MFVKRFSVLTSLVFASLALNTPAQAEVVGIEFVRKSEVIESYALEANSIPAANGGTAVELKLAQNSGSNSDPTPGNVFQVETPKTDFKNKITIDLDTGGTWITKNTIRIPSEGGSTFGLEPTQALATFRLYLTWAINKNHSIRLLYAPLSAESTFAPTTDLAFNGLMYLAGQPVTGYYQFNSYRLSYIYQFDPIGDLVYRIGFTAKIRDARVALTQNGNENGFDNIGFVPLIHVGARYSFLQNWFVDAELEGLAGGPGRAFDGALQVGRELNQNWSASVGYRFVEGGADVNVYNFAFIQSVFARISYSF